MADKKIDKLIAKDIIIEEMKKEIPINDIAIFLGVSKSRVQQIMREFKISGYPKLVTSYNIGDKIGRWTLLEKIKVKPTKDGYKTKWLCKCDCGTIRELRSGSIITKTGKIKTYSCGCYAIERQIERLWKGCGDLGGFYLARIRKGAKRRNIECSIDIEYIWQLFLEQNRKCALSGIELILPGKGQIKCNINEMTASLDRIDSSKGYIEGNVWWIHKDLNPMKLDLELKEFLYYIKQIYEYQKQLGNIQ